MPIRQDNLTSVMTPELTAAFVRTVSSERWRTYRLAAGFHDNTAIELYLWNAAIGQSFHFPLQTVEVALRNVIHNSLITLYGANWSSDPNFRGLLDPRLETDIITTERRHRNKYSSTPTTPQVVASLSLGFWVALLRPTYRVPIWSLELSNAFPHLAVGEALSDVSATGTKIQDLRNRIFHQEPLIGHNLLDDYSAIMRMLAWICPETEAWARKNSSVTKVIRERPRRK
jgi:hypothetical protein